MFMLAIACALPVLAAGGPASWLYALCLGGAYGAQQAINAAGYAQYFGRDHLGAIRGASYVFGVGGAAFGPLPFAVSADLTGAYTTVLMLSFVLCLACGAAALLIRRPATPTPGTPAHG
jgi:MFS-type transporter involved in bile tolerance (Atg22 family)